jgi:protein tyrosine phosphatase (PTP) superfamily phosphohydrolase (DUF442 family)
MIGRRSLEKPRPGYSNYEGPFAVYPAMRISRFTVAAILITTTLALAADPQGTNRARLDHIQQSLSSDVPRLLCLDESFATGGQPRDDAYFKAAAGGFRSVLSLRTAGEGIDLARERRQVETNKMRYFNIPVNSSSPRPEQADEFLRITRDKTNHPMLVTCATANRVGAFMMILRVLEQGWSLEEAGDEAAKIGLRGDELKKFARDYIAQQKTKRGRG